MSTPTAQLAQWAQQLAALGWRVFPITPGAKKPPMIGEWEQRATTDPDRISRCWQRASFNIGIATGPSGLVVIDLDVPSGPAGADQPDGAAGLAALAADRGVAVPETYTVATPSGGTHLYFTTPPGVRLRNTQDALAPAIDTRAAGGYVVAAGSITPGGAYELTDDTQPAELPAWLVQALTERRSPALSGRENRRLAGPERAVGRPDSYAATAVDAETERVRTAAGRQHNTVLSHAAYNLGQLVGADLLTPADATRALTDAAVHMIVADCDCTAREVQRVIAAGLTAGTARPRRRAQMTPRAVA